MKAPYSGSASSNHFLGPSVAKVKARGRLLSSQKLSPAKGCHDWCRGHEYPMLCQAAMRLSWFCSSSGQYCGVEKFVRSRSHLLSIRDCPVHLLTPAIRHSSQTECVLDFSNSHNQSDFMNRKRV
jgi:hypothetical protein